MLEEVGLDGVGVVLVVVTDNNIIINFYIYSINKNINFFIIKYMQYIYILLLSLISLYILSKYIKKFNLTDTFESEKVDNKKITIDLLKKEFSLKNNKVNDINEKFIETLDPISLVGNILSITYDIVAGGNLTVGGVLNAGDINVTKNWRNTANTTGAEISNDTKDYKTLMLVGNSSGGTRSVSVWDTLNVNGTLNTTGNTKIGGGLSANTLIAGVSGPNLSTISLNTPGTGYTFYAADSAYKNGNGLVPNHLQLFAYNAGAPKDAAINQMIDMYPQSPGNPNNTINLLANTNVANNLSVGGIINSVLSKPITSIVAKGIVNSQKVFQGQTGYITDIYWECYKTSTQSEPYNAPAYAAQNWVVTEFLCNGNNGYHTLKSNGNMTMPLPTPGFFYEGGYWPTIKAIDGDTWNIRVISIKKIYQ